MKRFWIWDKKRHLGVYAASTLEEAVYNAIFDHGWAGELEYDEAENEIVQFTRLTSKKQFRTSCYMGSINYAMEVLECSSELEEDDVPFLRECYTEGERGEKIWKVESARLYRHHHAFELHQKELINEGYFELKTARFPDECLKNEHSNDVQKSCRRNMSVKQDECMRRIQLKLN